MSTIKHIVFDIGHVLLHWDPEVPYRTLIPDESERHWFLSEVCNPEWNREQDRGREWSDAEDLLIKDHPGYADLIRAYRRDWMSMLTHTIDGNIELFKQVIEAGWDVTMLTNWHQGTYIEAGKVHKFLELPRGVTVSGEVKLIKPDPAIYQLHAKTFDLEPEAILFFDDSPNNVQAARDLGWVAELVSTPEVLKADLIRHGVLS
ncbi:MAG: HAD family hydrolase [Leucothrix sp.]